MAERINTHPHIVSLRIKRNKYFPNSRLPVLLYREALYLPFRKKRAGEIIRKIFSRNGWSNSWLNGIYDFHHYHSTTHECMGISRGSALIRLGGPNGKKIRLSQGDVIILPAGVAHQCIKKSNNFQCLGAYPRGKDYDMNTGTPEEYKKALNRIRTLPIPAHDPLLGGQGFIRMYWKKSTPRSIKNSP